MTELDVIKIHRMDDGTEYRASIAIDPDPQEPYDDGAWPILRVESRRYGHYDYRAEAFNRQAEAYVDKFNELWERLREKDAWERFCKIFLGSTRVEEYGPNQRTDYSYIAFDTPEWKESVGAPDDLGEEDPLTEIRAWIEGDVYGVTVHKRYNPDSILDEDEGWTDFEAGQWVWGFYGRKWAEQAALSELRDAVMSHKVVHRYPEHEKIDPHDREIRTILEFLEALDQDDMCLARIFDDNHNRLQRVPESRHQRVVFEHFGISYNKIEQERELMFKRLQEEANKEATD